MDKKESFITTTEQAALSEKARDRQAEEAWNSYCAEVYADALQATIARRCEQARIRCIFRLLLTTVRCYVGASVWEFKAIFRILELEVASKIRQHRRSPK